MISAEVTFFYLCRDNYTKLVNFYIRKNEEVIRKDSITLTKAANDNIIDALYYLLSKEKKIRAHCFNGNEQLTKIAIPSSIIHIELRAFNYCTSLAEVVIPSSVKTIGDYAFQGCHF